MVSCIYYFIPLQVNLSKLLLRRTEVYLQNVYSIDSGADERDESHLRFISSRRQMR